VNVNQQDERAYDALPPESASVRSAETRPGPVAWVLLLPIRAYRMVLSPLLPPNCRFYPSCSAYAVEALTRHGALRGLYLTVRRVLRCSPWHDGGLDPVPERFGWRVPRPGKSTEE
jgi:uncharacterized protein